MSVGKIPTFSEASRDQIVNKTWVIKHFTGMMGHHMETCSVNKLTIQLNLNLT